MSERVSSEELQRMVTNHQGDGDLAYACDCPWCRVCLDVLDARRERDELARLRAFDTGSAHLTAGQMLEFARLDEMWQRLVQERDSALHKHYELQRLHLRAGCRPRWGRRTKGEQNV
jgi:hypothetical protein